MIEKLLTEYGFYYSYVDLPVFYLYLIYLYLIYANSYSSRVHYIIHKNMQNNIHKNTHWNIQQTAT